jgi:hypothetical protein
VLVQGEGYRINPLTIDEEEAEEDDDEYERERGRQALANLCEPSKPK